MNFDTGSGSGRPDDESRRLFGGESGRQPPGGPPRGPVASPGGEFNLSDPVGSFIRTVVAIVTQPVAFFRGIARQGNFINPALFAVICALISAVLSGILGLIFTPLFAPPGDTEEAFAGGIGGFVVGLILTPLYTALALIIGAGILHLLVLLFVRPSNSGFEATFRAFSYGWGVTQLVSWVPVIGTIIATVWAIVLYIFGIREVHSATTGTATLIVLIPAVVLLLIVLLLVALGAALFFAGTQQQF
jgi:hypothetical protein